MLVNALLMGETDNVVTCTTDIAAGETVCYQKGGELFTLVAKENIPYCHKVAITAIAQGADVIKYNESLGMVSEAIAVGGWVADHNLFCVPRDYDAEMVPVEEEK